MASNTQAFEKRLLALEKHYHIHHPFNIAMNAGQLSKQQIQAWVLNRFYYQIMIPRKDAAILSNCDDIKTRQLWIQRILNHDGTPDVPGGIEAWIRLATACGLSREQTLSLDYVYPSVRFAVDAYYNFVKNAPWPEGICSSLTELFAPKIHKQRLHNWPKHYPWVEPHGLQYFQNRVSQVQDDVKHGLSFVLNYFKTEDQQMRAIEIVKFKLDVLWSISDAIIYEHPLRDHINSKKIHLSQGFRLQFEEAQNCYVLLFPEGMIQLNETSAEILKLCDGQNSEDDILYRLQEKYPNADIRADINEFIAIAFGKGWICAS